MSNDDIRAGFFEECDDLLAALGDGLTALEQNGSDIEVINAVFRAVHSIKGGAGAFGLDPLVGFAHVFENLLDGLRNEVVTLDKNVLGLCFRAGDHLADQVEAAQAGGRADPADNAALVAEIGQHLASDQTTAASGNLEFAAMPIALDLPGMDTAAAASDPVARFSFATLPGFFEAGHEPLLFLRQLADLTSVKCHHKNAPGPWVAFDPATSGFAVDISLDPPLERYVVSEVFGFAEGLCDLDFAKPSQEQRTIPAPSTTPAPPPPTTKSTTAPSSTIRVDLGRVERLNYLAGELVITQAMLKLLLEAPGVDLAPEMRDEMEHLRNLSNDLQDSVIAIRAQPIKPLFSRMSRILREAAKSSGKAVRLETQGAETEIDKSALERLGDPLTHMVRNAVDHGLENQSERIAKGKPEEGRITLCAAHRSGKVVIELSDDGAGINRERVRDIAISKGLIESSAVLSDAEVDNLLFLPGFSTAEQVSDLSGRGVGMDVARSEIEALGGRVSIRSESGRGTQLTITLPLTLAVLEGMTVQLAMERMVIPITSIVETLRASETNLSQVAQDAWMVSIRGSFLPLVDLANYFGFRPALADFCGKPLLVVETADYAHIAVAVDQILDQSQVVIKGIAEHYQSVPGVSAATILGDGQIALIVDPEEISSPEYDPPVLARVG